MVKQQTTLGEDTTWTHGPWTPTLGHIHGPLINLKPEARTLTLTLEEHVRVLGFNPVLDFGSGPWTQSKVGVQCFLLTQPHSCGLDIIM